MWCGPDGIVIMDGDWVGPEWVGWECGLALVTEFNGLVVDSVGLECVPVDSCERLDVVDLVWVSMECVD